jgi:Ca2+-transporting ATPase
MALRVVRTAGGPRLSVKGAPEMVLDRCTDADRTDDLRRAASDAATRGGRVIAVAGADSSEPDAPLQPLGLLVFEDPPRASAAAAVEACRRAGIRLVLATGDHPATAATIAAASGLDVHTVVTGATVPAEPASTRADVLHAADVVARVDPVTKVDLVLAHQRAGEIVAMVGDGVNDAPALRRADVGVAIAGAGGTDVAREAADIVIVDEDLDTIVEAVVAGRAIDRSLVNVVSYLLAGNLSEIAVVIGVALLLPELGVPLLPAQLLWLNLVTDGVPAGALGVDRPADESTLLRSRRRPGERLLSGARARLLTARAAAVAGPALVAGWLADRADWTDEVVRAQVLLALVGSHLLLAYGTRATRWAFERGWWRGRAVALAVGGSLLLQVPVFTLPPLRRAFELGALPPAGWLLAGSAAIGSVALVEVVRIIFRSGASRDVG